MQTQNSNKEILRDNVICLFHLSCTRVVQIVSIVIDDVMGITISSIFIIINEMKMTNNI